MRTVFVEDYEEFSARHGGDSVAVNYRRYWPDGATSDAEGTTRYEPPRDPIAVLRLRKVYAKEKVRQAEVDFASAQSSFTELARNAARYSSPMAPLPTPPANAAEILRSLKEPVKKWREQLAEIEAELSQTPNEVRRREMEQEAIERQRQVANVYSEITAINLND